METHRKDVKTCCTAKTTDDTGVGYSTSTCFSVPDAAALGHKLTSADCEDTSFQTTPTYMSAIAE